MVHDGILMASDVIPKKTGQDFVPENKKNSKEPASSGHCSNALFLKFLIVFGSRVVAWYLFKTKRWVVSFWDEENNLS